MSYIKGSNDIIVYIFLACNIRFRHMPILTYVYKKRLAMTTCADGQRHGISTGGNDVRLDTIQDYILKT